MRTLRFVNSLSCSDWMNTCGYALQCITAKQLKGQLTKSPVAEVFNKDYAIEYLQHYVFVKGQMGDTDRTLKAMNSGMSHKWIHSNVGQIKKKLTEKLDILTAAAFFITSAKNHSPATYKINIRSENITIK
jgi:hypothetical protein